MPRFGGLYPPRPRDHGAAAGARGGGGMKKATGLGRGLGALLGEAPSPPAQSTSADGGVRTIEVARIRPNPAQPRQIFDEQAMAELAASIAERGVLQPILVRP